jgi:hypothetical protein
MPSSGMLRRVALVRTDASEDYSASIIRMARIAELRTTQAVTINRRRLRRNTIYKVPSKRRFLQEPHGVTSQKTPFFTVTAVKTSNLTRQNIVSSAVDSFTRRKIKVELITYEQERQTNADYLQFQRL